MSPGRFAITAGRGEQRKAGCVRLGVESLVVPLERRQSLLENGEGQALLGRVERRAQSVATQTKRRMLLRDRFLRQPL
jgi:hypothetical protein